MKDELTLLIEKLLRGQTEAGELSRLKELFIQAEAKDMLSDLYDKKWEQAASDSEKDVEERIWSKLHKQIQSEPVGNLAVPVKYSLLQKGLRIAASVLIPLFCIGLGYFASENKGTRGNDKITVRAEAGQKAGIQLPDGSSILLNSSSSLTYDGSFNNKERIVYLQGEAYFEVNKDKARPFIVKVNDISVEALGTSFDVKAYPDDNYIMATLIEGSIRVKSPYQSEVLFSNEKLTLSKSNGAFTKNSLPDAAKNISWIDNRLAFEQEPLGNIAKILERMYSIRIIFASDELKDIRFSGVINNNSLDNVLQLITLVSPVSYSRKNNATIIIHSK
ncbi:MAG: FecR domain-containing protein [Prevotella sp.]|jgi:ferric-dicitrate binding protein FerR (iron transport regulator)|nr:FecR domain-containing protein [Prevotella sp.]